MTDSWIEQYSAALDVRDSREQAHKSYIDAYTKLADRTAAAGASLPPPSDTPSTSEAPSKITNTKSTTKDAEALLSSLRTDLASTQRARTQTQVSLQQTQTELSALQSNLSSAQTQLTSLTNLKTSLERKLRDRESELQSKARLVSDVQDEMVALQLQLNLSEEKREKVEKENEDLVKRWVERMGEEVERVNRESRWDQ